MDLDFTETLLYLPCPHKGQCLAGSSLLVTLCSPSESEMSTQGQGKRVGRFPTDTSCYWALNASRQNILRLQTLG